MTYRTKSCPHCGHVYARMETTRFHYGSPFRICAKCRRTFVDKSYRELACIEHGRPKVKKIDPFSIFSLIVGLFLIVLGLFDYVDPESGGMFLLYFLGGTLFFGGGLYTLQEDISSFDSRQKSLARELAESKQRLSNPAYAKALVQLGVHVPDEYLQPPPRKEKIYLMEAVNGTLVRVPESKLAAWNAGQAELRKKVRTVIPAVASNKEETIYYMEAANGMTVRVPESKLESWQAEQDRSKNDPAAAELTEGEKKLRDAILHDLYRKSHYSCKGSENHD